MKEKTLQDKWDEEILTDNTQFKLCEQCKDCVFQSDGTIWSNRYNKSSCQKYQYPNMKPLEVINNLTTCPYRETR